MGMTKAHKVLSLILCMVLIAAMALFATGCSAMKAEETKTVDSTTVYADGDVIGEGAKQFTLVVTDKDGNSIILEVHTDKTTVGEALLDNNVIAGEDGDYGLYVKTVNGITADYDVDKTYWGFYIDGEYAMTGVDATDIVEGTTYTLAVGQ